MMILWILVPCVIAGVCLAGMAVWLSTRKGNTISDVMRSQRSADVNAIRVEILDKLKLASNIPIVALYVVAFFVAIPLPAFVSWNLLKDASVITLSGKVENIDGTKRVCVTPKGMRIESTGIFELPLPYSSQAQTINFEGEHYLPVTLLISVNKARTSLLVEVANATTAHPEKEIPLNLETMRASLPWPIPLVPATAQPAPSVRNQPSGERPVSSAFERAGAPPGVNP